MTPGPDVPELRLFLDRSTNSRRFAEIVRTHVPDVVTIGERYGVRPAEHVQDGQWLAEATAEGRICVGADKMILSNELEIAAVLEHRARYVVFANNNMTGRAQAERFVACLGELREAAGREGPWALKITGSGLVEVSVEQLRERLARRRQRN
ncbi:hypothetical protein CUT44_29090 [Streptomyces carminius]|uniref:VapC45 PIN like domain-containing protein n=1 Tax=Streptomyces carminius TaxID=2665496 RepID=A0A2M8LQT2_9ACTN|nr:hypothetical protein [Streptomyces carminius]PJE94318.1 hypothetical protein CUT44_29090 [Streptomyces carminius]